MDATDPEERDGVIDDPIEVHASEVAGRIPDVNLQRVVLVMAFNVSSLSVDEHVPLTLSGRILLVDRLQGTYSIDPFMDTAQGFYHQADRQLTISDIPQDADCIEAIFEDENNSAWHFLSEARTGSFNLPPAPPEGDRAERVKLLTIKLKDNIEYQDLPAFNDTSLSNLLQHVEAFSITEIP